MKYLSQNNQQNRWLHSRPQEIRANAGVQAKKNDGIWGKERFCLRSQLTFWRVS